MSPFFHQCHQRSGHCGLGSRAIATVGGAAAADKNTFRNYAQFKCTYRSRHPQEGLAVIVGGDGLSLDDANLYDNSPAPHHFSE